MDKDPIPDGIIQYSWKWGNTAEWSNWQDAPDEDNPVEMTQGFFLRSRVKPLRCEASIGIDGLMVECERRAHDDPGEDEVHEGAAYGIPGEPVIRWTDPGQTLKRVFPKWDAHLQTQIKPIDPGGM